MGTHQSWVPTNHGYPPIMGTHQSWVPTNHGSDPPGLEAYESFLTTQQNLSIESISIKCTEAENVLGRVNKNSTKIQLKYERYMSLADQCDDVILIM